MPEHRGNNKAANNKKKAQTNREGDWICQVCSNYNYSFRLKCNWNTNAGNRCQVQSKVNNNTLTILYDENCYYISEVAPVVSSPPATESSFEEEQ